MSVLVNYDIIATRMSLVKNLATWLQFFSRCNREVAAEVDHKLLLFSKKSYTVKNVINISDGDCLKNDYLTMLLYNLIYSKYYARKYIIKKQNIILG